MYRCNSYYLETVVVAVTAGPQEQASILKTSSSLLNNLILQTHHVLWVISYQEMRFQTH